MTTRDMLEALSMFLMFSLGITTGLVVLLSIGLLF